jgi:DNA-binding PadR family transcriptional regulator
VSFMFFHLILGMLRDGDARHGYELMSEYAARSGSRISAGSFYRELARLASSGLVETGVNPPDADARRIPYRIKDAGRQSFDTWLKAPAFDDGDLTSWMLFANRLTSEARARILERREEELWMRSKALARLRDDAISRDRKRDRFDPLPVLLSRQIKQLTGELETLQEFRLELDAWTSPPPSPPAAATVEQPRMSRRKKATGRK